MHLKKTLANKDLENNELKSQTKHSVIDSTKRIVKAVQCFFMSLRSAFFLFYFKEAHSILWPSQAPRKWLRSRRMRRRAKLKQDVESSRGRFVNANEEKRE